MTKRQTKSDCQFLVSSSCESATPVMHRMSHILLINDCSSLANVWVCYFMATDSCYASHESLIPSE